MAENAAQTYKNHARFDPLYHFFMVPLTLVLLVWSVTHAIRHYSHEAIAWVVVALLIFLALFKLRSYALKAQDRVIRLEERMRLEGLGASAPIAQLTEGQLVALRFASDPELPGLAAKAVAENLTQKQIKQAIQAWRPDHFRV